MLTMSRRGTETMNEWVENKTDGPMDFVNYVHRYCSHSHNELDNFTVALLALRPFWCDECAFGKRPYVVRLVRIKLNERTDCGCGRLVSTISVKISSCETIFKVDKCHWQCAMPQYRVSQSKWIQWCQKGAFNLDAKQFVTICIVRVCVCWLLAPVTMARVHCIAWAYPHSIRFQNN